MQRARTLVNEGSALKGSEAFLFFLKGISGTSISASTLDKFAQLDDVDVLSAIKSWQHHSDVVLSKLCQMVLNRNLLHVKIKNRPIAPEKLEDKLEQVQNDWGLSVADASCFVFTGEISNKAYSGNHQAISILKKNGKVTDVLRESDQLSLKALSKTVTKYYCCYPKQAV